MMMPIWRAVLDLPHGRSDFGGIEVRHFHLGDLLHLAAIELTDLFP